MFTAFQRTEFLPYQSEIISEKGKGCELVLFARDRKQRKVVVVVKEIPLCVMVDVSKASQVLNVSVEECRARLCDDVGHSGKLAGIEKRFPFHEYSAEPHEYQRVKFWDINGMNAYIERFNARELRINAENSYLSDEEYGNLYMYKLSRESDLSLCDWCEVKYKEGDVEVKEGVICITVYGVESVRQVDRSTVFDETGKDAGSRPLLVAFWDIETYTEREEKQVNITQDSSKNNNIALRSIPFVISIAFFWSDSDQLYRGYTISTVMHQAPEREGVSDIIVKSEREALMVFINVLSQNKPDLISGFNDNSFDWIVILNRCDVYKADNLLTKLYHALSLDWCVGREIAKVQKHHLIREQKIKIKGDETITCNRFKFRGCLTVDTMCLFRKMYPNDDRYSLNHFLTKLGLQQKDDVSYVELERFRRASVAVPDSVENMQNMGRVVQYCFNDSALLQKLWQSRKVLQENRELAKASFTDLEHAFFRANGGKVRNMVIGFIKRFAKELGVSNTRRIKDAPSKYQGAHVFEVSNYLNRESPTACLDFNSLYPSIIIAYNFSPEKVAVEGHGDQGTAQMRPIDVTLDDKTTIKGKVSWHDNQEALMGVYARILKRLFERRVGIKDEMSALKQATKRKDLPEKERTEAGIRLDILDTQQLALKVLMNTFYGEAGNALSPFYNVLVAASVTKKGQELIKYANAFVEDRGWKTRYGDTDSLYISAPEADLQCFRDQNGSVRERWSKMVDFTIAGAKTLQAEINSELKVYTQTSFLKMAYEKVLFPVVFFSKKVYCGYKHENFAMLEEGKEDLSISGFQIKKKGNAKILETIGLKLIHSILQPHDLPRLDVLVRDVLDENFSNPSLDNIDDFSITQTYRKEKNNIRINQFVSGLPDEYRIEDLAKFDYVFVRRPQYDEITGKKIPDSKARHMLLKCMYDPGNPDTQLDYYQYITGSIKGVLMSVLKLKFDEKEAEQIIKDIISRYDSTDKEGMTRAKKDFSQKQSGVMSELKRQYKSLYKSDKIKLHFFEKTLLGSTNGLLRHIAADVENDVGDCPIFQGAVTDSLYSEAIETKQEIIDFLQAIRSAHARLETDPSKIVKCTKLIVAGLDVQQIISAIHDTQNEIEILWEVVNERYKYLTRIVTTIENQLGVTMESFRIANMIN